MTLLRKLDMTFWLWYIGYSWNEAWDKANKRINWLIAEETINKWLS